MADTRFRLVNPRKLDLIPRFFEDALAAEFSLKVTYVKPFASIHAIETCGIHCVVK